MHRTKPIAWSAAALLPALLVVAGCGEARVHETDSGGVILSISDFNFGNLTDPLSASEQFPLAQGDSIQVTSVVTAPGDTSQLMTVEIQGYQVTYRRGDTGTRVPPALLQNVFGSVAPGSTFTLNGVNILRADQFNSQPLRDLIDRGIDLETGSAVVRLTLGIRFFGRTVSGRAVESNTAELTLDIVQ
jgi:hypothetical protein